MHRTPLHQTSLWSLEPVSVTNVEHVGTDTGRHWSEISMWRIRIEIKQQPGPGLRVEQQEKPGWQQIYSNMFPFLFSVLSCLVLSCPVLSLPCPVLSCPVLSCPVLLSAHTLILVNLVVVNFCCCLTLLEMAPSVLDHLWTQDSLIFPLTSGGKVGR